MADAVLRMNVGYGEADGASMYGKKAYFFDSFANALAALDDADPGTSTGVQTLKAVDRLDNSIGAAITGKYATVDEFGEIVVSMDNAADKYMIIPNSGRAVDPLFIPAEKLD